MISRKTYYGLGNVREFVGSHTYYIISGIKSTYQINNNSIRILKYKILYFGIYQHSE